MINGQVHIKDKYEFDEHVALAQNFWKLIIRDTFSSDHWSSPVLRYQLIYSQMMDIQHSTSPEISCLNSWDDPLHVWDMNCQFQTNTCSSNKHQGLNYLKYSLHSPLILLSLEPKEPRAIVLHGDQVSLDPRIGAHHLLLSLPLKAFRIFHLRWITLLLLSHL